MALLADGPILVVARHVAVCVEWNVDGSGLVTVTFERIDAAMTVDAARRGEDRHHVPEHPERLVVGLRCARGAAGRPQAEQGDSRQHEHCPKRERATSPIAGPKTEPAKHRKDHTIVSPSSDPPTLPEAAATYTRLPVRVQLRLGSPTMKKVRPPRWSLRPRSHASADSALPAGGADDVTWSQMLLRHQAPEHIRGCVGHPQWRNLWSTAIAFI